MRDLTIKINSDSTCKEAFYCAVDLLMFNLKEMCEDRFSELTQIDIGIETHNDEDYGNSYVFSINEHTNSPQ